MKDGAVLFNYARGPIVDEDAVLAAIESGKSAGHITDFPSEKMIGHDKILISAHISALRLPSLKKTAPAWLSRN